MRKLEDTRHSTRQYSEKILFVAFFTAIILLAVLLECVCLGILYVNESLKGRDTSMFAAEHLLTRPFVSSPIAPLVGKHFVDLRIDHDWTLAEFHIPDDLLGWRLASNISAFYHDPNNKYLYVTDDNGFIVDVDEPPVALQKSVDTYRVIVLGGSTVMGEGAPYPSQNLVGMLRKGVRERELTGSTAKRVEFINAGVNAYNSAQEYLYFVSDLLRFKPDLVVVYDGWNDSDYDLPNYPSPFRTHEHLKNTERLRRSDSIAGAVSLVAANLTYSLIDGNSRLGIIELPWRAFRSLSLNGEHSESSPAPFDPRTIEYYRINHQAFLAIADDKLSVAIFLQPLVGIDNRELSAEERNSWWYPQIATELVNRSKFYNGAHRVIADLKERSGGKNNLCVADLSQTFNGVIETVYADSGHLTPSGNQIVAAQMLKELVSCGILREQSK